MSNRDDPSAPEKRASAAFPIGILLLAICAIFVYLTIGGAVLDDDTKTAVYIPQMADASGPR